MEEFIIVEPGYSDSTSPISEPPDITNWFPSYVYESLPLSFSINGSENEVDLSKANLGVTVTNKDHKPMYKKIGQISDSNYESLPSEPPDIGNWFSSYVYESPMLDTSDGLEWFVPGESESIKEKETDKATPEIDKNDVCPGLSEQELFSSAKVTDLSQSQSVLSEPPDFRNWVSSYEYESPQLSDIHELGFSSFENEELIVEESETEEESSCGIFPKTTSKQETIAPGRLESNDCKDNITAKTVTDLSLSQSVLSEPPDFRNWVSSYEYESPQLSDIHELGFSSFEKEELIVEESDTEEEHSCGIFRKTTSNQETIAPGRLESNDCKDYIAADTATEISSDNANSDPEMVKQLSVGFFNASKKEVIQESSFKQEKLCCEPKEEAKISLGVSWYNPKRKSPSKHNPSLHELRPKHTQETISMNFNRRKSPTAIGEKNLESLNQESDDKENEAGFVTLKKARFSEARDRSSMAKPNTGVQVECSNSKELKNVAGEGDKDERKQKRRILREMSNHQPSRPEEMAGKWRCPQKNKRNIVPPKKQLRLDAWIHKV